MKDMICAEFQEAVRECLIRHRSVLDVLSKMSESNARITRAVSKAVTACGCVEINASKPRFPDDINLTELREYMKTHLNGHLCEECLDIVETEMGSQLFYLVALCDCFDIDLFDVMVKEKKKLDTLGVFNFS